MHEKRCPVTDKQSNKHRLHGSRECQSMGMCCNHAYLIRITFPRIRLKRGDNEFQRQLEAAMTSTAAASEAAAKAAATRQAGLHSADSLRRGAPAAVQTMMTAKNRLSELLVRCPVMLTPSAAHAPYRSCPTVAYAPLSITPCFAYAASRPVSLMCCVPHVLQSFCARPS
jgi:hypothetical protein